MVQVLPYVPGFGQKLGEAFGGILNQLGEGYQQRKTNQNDERIIQGLGDVNLTPVQQIQALARLSPNKAASIGPSINQLMKNQALQQEAQQQQQTVEQEAQKEQQDVAATINNLADEIDKGKLGKGYAQFHRLTKSGRESRAYFDQLAFSLEKRLADKVGKGTLSKPRFEYLISHLPSSKNTDSENRGILKGLAEDFKVDVRSSKMNKPKEKSNLESFFYD